MHALWPRSWHRLWAPLGQNTYGYCALRLKNMVCPYKDCIHSLTITSPESEQQAEGAEEPTAEQMET